MRARARTISGIVCSIPSARRSSSARLVSTVTPRILHLARRRLGRARQHLVAARGVHGQQLGLDARRRGDRARHRLGDVVQLEVEEDAPAARAHQLDGALALGDEQLEPDLVEGRAARRGGRGAWSAPRRSGTSSATITRSRAGMSCAGLRSSRCAPLAISATTIFTASSIFILRTSGAVAALHLDDPLGDPLLADGDAERDADQVGVLELHAGRSSRSS